MENKSKVLSEVKLKLKNKQAKDTQHSHLKEETTLIVNNNLLNVITVGNQLRTSTLAITFNAFPKSQQ